MKIISIIGLILFFLSCQNSEQSLIRMPNYNEIEFRNFLSANLKTLETDSTAISFHKKLDPIHCQNDLITLKHVLEEAQTSVFRFCSKADFDELFNKAFVELQDSIYYQDFIKIIAKIDHQIACGHSGWGHAQAYYKYRNSFVKLFPFDVEMKDGKMFVLRDNSEENEIFVGSEIIEINKTPILEVIQGINAYLVKDGTSNIGFSEGEQSFFSNAYSNFVEQTDHFKISVLQNGHGKPLTFQTNALLKPELDSIRKTRYDVKPKFTKPLLYDYLDSISTGVYTINWFNKDYINHYNQNFERFTDSVFADLNTKDATNLIIDLRGNVGGWTAYGKYLFSYFIDQKLDYIKKVEIKKYEGFSFDSIITSYPQYLDTFKLQKNNDHLFEWINYPSLQVEPKDKNQFKGQVYILTDGLVRSCTGVFSTMMKQHTNANFYGTETGSSQCGAGGMVMAIELPYTGISYYFSTAKYTTAIKDSLNSNGVMPDKLISPQKAKDHVIDQISKQKL